MGSKQSSRRRFLKGGAALAGLAIGGIPRAIAQVPRVEKADAPPGDSRAYGHRSRFDTSKRLDDTHAPHGMTTPIQDTTGIITPNGLHFVMDHDHMERPDIDPKQHRLLIHGQVDRPLSFTLEELKTLPSVSKIYFIECNGNSQPPRGPGKDSVQDVHGRISCSEWTGVPLALLLREAGLKAGATWLVAEGADAKRYAMGIPLTKGMEDVLVAYGQNGEPVRPEQGYPLRLIIPGFEGNISIKWLRRIKVVDQLYVPRHQATNAELMPNGKALWFNFQIGAKSVITRPSGGQKLPGPGFYEITGLAWSGGGAVHRVEVSTDGGKSWKDAELQQPVLPMAWTRFRSPWTWNGQEAVLQSRCTDERGEVQPTLAQLREVWGINSDFYFQDHFNGIQPWKVTPDGVVHNALLLS
ncbi:MAG: sulfite dehydrogenase [Acidobacteria bacterium]|nr:sulfite dehydrogenase [Acidobacteriota bacterium]